jgi:methyltransferase family protein
MISKVVRRAANMIGVDVFPHKLGGWHWSHTADSYYPVSPKSRWGYGKPPHAKLEALFCSQRGQFSALLEQMLSAKFILDEVPARTANAEMPSWHNNFFSSLDACALVGMLHLKRPKRYLEIGSGNSTKFARFAIDRANIETDVIAIDPHPRAEIDGICDKLIRKPLEECGSIVLDEIRSGDIVFFDGSHRVFQNSDVTVFFLEILPNLPSGVTVQIHDIVLPEDYPPEWHTRLYSEQYLLAAMLLVKEPPFRTLLPNCFACLDPVLRPKAGALVTPHMSPVVGGSFWLETL